MKKILTQETVNKIIWIVFVVSIIYLGIGWLLYLPLRNGGRGIYWLVTTFTFTVLPFVGLCFLCWVISFFAWLSQADKEKRHFWSKRANILFVEFLVFFASSFVFLFAPFHHLKSLSTGNHVYYLNEVYNIGDVNFQLHECDSIGLMCSGVYRSYDFPIKHKKQADFEFDKINKTVNVIFTPTKEILFSYPVP